MANRLRRNLPAPGGGLHSYAFLPAALLGLVAILSASCEGIQVDTRVGGTGGDAGPQRITSVENLATQLGMEVRRQSPNMATLANAENFVFLYAPPNAGASVNGRRIGNGGVTVWNNRLYVTQDLAGHIRAQLRPPPPTVAVPVPANSGYVRGTVVLDAGHGGKDPGAPNPYGPSEKHITLDTTLRIRELLTRQGVTVILTREGDTYPTLDERVALANRVRPDLFISIHADSAPNPNARGYTVYAARGASAKSLAAAQHLHHSLQSAGIASRGIDRANFRVVSATASPALLVELGFLSNAAEARLLGAAEYRQHLAEAIAQGIIASLRESQGLARIP